MVVLDANPLDDIANTKKIHAVVFKGKLSNRSTLDGMLKAVETLAAKVHAAEHELLPRVIAKLSEARFTA